MIASPNPLRQSANRPLNNRPIELWRADPSAWAGQTCHVIGGGLSVADLDVSRLSGRIIATNTAGLDVAPMADILLYSDERWRSWNAHRLHLYRGPLMLTCRRPPIFDRRIRVIRYNGKAGGATTGLSLDPERLGGQCSGSRALNLAVLMGAARVILHGFDMRPGHYHGGHKSPTGQLLSPPPSEYNAFMRTLERMADALNALPVTVINATPGSALGCFPMSEAW